MSCLNELKQCMTNHKLRLNEEKTEFLVLSSPHFRPFLKHLMLKFGSVDITQSDKAKNLGVVFDNVMNMQAQVSTICISAYFHLRNIGCIRKYLTLDSTAMLIHSLISSRLDYCNSLLTGLPAKEYSRLQKVQNTAARILTLTRKHDHITPVLMDLHWLPITLRVQFKILLLTFRIIHGLAPCYLNDLITFYCPQRSLRSSSQQLLTQPKHNLKTYGQRSFSAVAPKYWNALPIEIKIVPDIKDFKSCVKTYLFKKFIDSPADYIK